MGKERRSTSHAREALAFAPGQGFVMVMNMREGATVCLSVCLMGEIANTLTYLHVCLHSQHSQSVSQTGQGIKSFSLQLLVLHCEPSSAEPPTFPVSTTYLTSET